MEGPPSAFSTSRRTDKVLSFRDFTTDPGAVQTKALLLGAFRKGWNIHPETVWVAISMMASVSMRPGLGLEAQTSAPSAWLWSC